MVGVTPQLGGGGRSPTLAAEGAASSLGGPRATHRAAPMSGEGRRQCRRQAWGVKRGRVDIGNP